VDGPAKVHWAFQFWTHHVNLDRSTLSSPTLVNSVKYTPLWYSEMISDLTVSCCASNGMQQKIILLRIVSSFFIEAILMIDDY
jgi:hypothetical protein